MVEGDAVFEQGDFVEDVSVDAMKPVGEELLDDGFVISDDEDAAVHLVECPRWILSFGLFGDDGEASVVVHGRHDVEDVRERRRLVVAQQAEEHTAGDAGHGVGIEKKTYVVGTRHHRDDLQDAAQEPLVPQRLIASYGEALQGLLRASPGRFSQL